MHEAVIDGETGLTVPAGSVFELAKALTTIITEPERRIQMAGQCKGHAETAKIAVRGCRRDANKLVDTEEKGSILTEDDAVKVKEQIQELTKQYETKIDETIESKKAEIMQV